MAWLEPPGLTSCVNWVSSSSFRFSILEKSLLASQANLAGSLPVSQLHSWEEDPGFSTEAAAC